MFINSKLKVFIIAGVIFSSLYGFMVFQHRVPFAHDTFQYLQLQYIYFNEIVQNHSIPLWFPFISQGSVGNYYFTPQLNPLSPVFYLSGLFFKNVNYLYLFYFSLWFEELFFLSGIVLLSSLYYKNIKTIFFVSITLLGTSIWYPQVWWNFHLYYFLPIVLYCIHKSLITGLFRYFIFSIIFFTLAVYGNFIYCIIFISFVIMLYLLFIIPAELDNVKSFLRKNMKPVKLAALLVLISIIALSIFYIKYGAGEIAYTSQTRDSSGRNNLYTFLTYGGSTGIDKYNEVFARYGKSFDINLYAGFFLMPFVLIALFEERRRLALCIGGVSLVVFLFSIQTFVSVFFYYLFPFGNLFRHIGLTATVFKLFIVFYAGFGFEIFLERMDTDRRLSYIILIFLIAFISLLKPYIYLDKDYFWNMSEAESNILSILTYFLLAVSIALFGLILKSKIKKELFLSLLLLVMAIDLFSYKYSLTAARMPRVSASVAGLFKPYKYDFPEERLVNTDFHLKDNERMQLFNSVNFKGTVYNTIESFLFTDSAVSKYRGDFMPKSIKEYFNTMREFPNNNGAYEKYSAVGYPKLGVFSKLNIVNNESAMGHIFNLKGFTGDMLFASAGDIRDIEKGLHTPFIVQQDNGDFINRNERINANIYIGRFSFNTLNLKVAVDGPANGYCFLYYSDAYHPYWSAYVNGRKAVVIKSNIGYKSVMIPYGTSEVVFKFGNIVYYASISCSILLCLVILGLTVYLFGKGICNG